jgi:Cu(I)/Ag(I) efflux system membrane fusion protein
MDPQVMEKQPGMCPICKMALTKATIDTKQMQGIQINDEQAKLANIKVEAITQSSIGRNTTLNGVFAINQNRTEQISARIKGRIELLYYKINGAKVNKGDKLYELYSRELLQAQEEYLLALEKGKLLKTGPAKLYSSSKK